MLTKPQPPQTMSLYSMSSISSDFFALTLLTIMRHARILH